MQHPQSAKRSTFSYKMGQNGVFVGGLRGWGSKSPLFGSKRSTFWGSHTPHQNQSWLRAWKYWTQIAYMQIFIQSHWTSSGIAKKFNEIGWKFACKVMKKRNPVFWGGGMDLSSPGGYSHIWPNGDVPL